LKWVHTIIGNAKVYINDTSHGLEEKQNKILVQIVFDNYAKIFYTINESCSSLLKDVIAITEPKVKSLYKAIKLLDYFTNEHPERGISELSDLSGMLKSTIHNIVTTFELTGFLEKDLATSKYKLGTKILQLSNNLYASHDLRRIVRPYLEKFSNYSRETVFLATMSEGEVVYIDSIYPIGVNPGRSVIGEKAPLYCTGVGKALLAHLAETTIEKLLEQELVPFTPNTIIEPQLLRAELKQIRNLGFAIDNMEHEYGIKCIAVPIKNIKGKVIASVSVSGPSLRFTESKIQEYAKMLLDASCELKEFIQG
jgi:DNA-binding IclR family transcriptional regulator